MSHIPKKYQNHSGYSLVEVLIGSAVGIVAIGMVSTLFTKAQSYFHNTEIKKDIAQARMMISSNADCKATMKDSSGGDRVDCANYDGSLLKLYKADNLDTPMLPYDGFGFGKVGKISIKVVCLSGHAVFSYALINPRTGAPTADPAVYNASTTPQWLNLYSNNYSGFKPFDVIPCP